MMRSASNSPRRRRAGSSRRGRPSVQQGRAAAIVGDVSGSPQSAAGVFRGRPDRRAARNVLCAQAALFARRRQRRAGQRRRDRGGAGRTVWRRRIHSSGAGAVAGFSGQYPVLGSWLVDHVACGLSIREDENPITGKRRGFCRTRSCKDAGRPSERAQGRQPCGKVRSPSTNDARIHWPEIAGTRHFNTVIASEAKQSSAAGSPGLLRRKCSSQ